MKPPFSTWSILYLLSALSLLSNFTAQWSTRHEVEFSSEATRVSWALQHNRGFSDPYLTGPSGPTAQMAPIYPALHAIVCLIFGTGAVGWAAIVALTAFVWALQWAFAFDFLNYYGHPFAGLGAALFGVLLPLPGRLFKWEAVFAACVLAAAASVVARLIDNPNPIKTCLFGVAAAISVLLAPATALVFFIWGLILLLRRPFRSAVSILATALLFVTPPLAFWTVRNYWAFGHVFFVRDDAGMVLASSNLDCAGSFLSTNVAPGCFATVHPSANIDLLEKLKEQGEFNYSANQMRAVVQWVRTHPSRFATLTFQRIVGFWFPIEIQSKPVLINGSLMSFVTALSLLSIFWRRSVGFLLLAGALLSFPLIYYLAQLEQRYRYPIYWMSVLLAAVGVELFFRALSKRSRSDL